MKPSYDSDNHAFATFDTAVLKGGAFRGPCAIVHHTGDRVWVPATFLDKDTAAIRVGDGTSSGFDRDGNCIVSISTKLVTGYLTMEEAEREMK
jgi:hypothetical protein